MFIYPVTLTPPKHGKLQGGRKKVAILTGTFWRHLNSYFHIILIQKWMKIVTVTIKNQYKKKIRIKKLF